MSIGGQGRRWYLPAVAGLLLLLLGGGVLTGVFVGRPKSQRTDTTGARALALQACTSFEPVYDATNPGAPVDEQRLAGKLDSAISTMHAAADRDATWKDLADQLDEVAEAVNAGDALRAATALQDVHRCCEAAKGSS